MEDALREYPNVTESSRFVFVPDPANPGSASIFPRPRMEGNNITAKMGKDLSQGPKTDTCIKP